MIFAVVVLAIAAVLLAVRSHNATGSGPYCCQLIYGDNNAVMDIPLEKDETYSVDTGYLPCTYQV